ncbi:hypothetical protein [Ramlibacter rhizophilus]|uniref:Uncharacterized protein n=1 Tax=Ramlibacter rhizophilus TaxID=1781167 RepID=A0A4Z0BBE4_9BURK|nr:hypothetical protein [Ramlibacter rhizophilus]TFY96445.1 hypothetical protein EZ242_20675 [Ramlibacter rhizophilus]
MNSSDHDPVFATLLSRLIDSSTRFDDLGLKARANLAIARTVPRPDDVAPPAASRLVFGTSAGGEWWSGGAANDPVFWVESSDRDRAPARDCVPDPSGIGRECLGRTRSKVEHWLRRER